jgi:hypothetical protein
MCDNSDRIQPASKQWTQIWPLQQDINSNQIGTTKVLFSL